MSADDTGHEPFAFEREAWTKRGACRGTDTAVFFTERGDPTAPAKAICAGCPVKDECLDYALRTGQKFGIWGGTSERERRRIRRALPKAEPAHGTVARYARGCRCEDCRAANCARSNRYRVAGRVA